MEADRHLIAATSVRRGSGTAAALVLTGALLVSACTRGAELADPPATTVAPSSTTSTTDPPNRSTSSTSTSTSTVATDTPPRCPAPTTGSPLRRVVDADLDGDALPDRLGVVDADGWQLVARFGDGGLASATIGADVAAVDPLPLGSTDLDDDGTPEIWVRVGFGASSEVVGLYLLDRCDLLAVTDGPDPALFPVGGSAGSVAGVRCERTAEGPAIVTRTASTQDGERFDGERRDHLLVGDALRVASTASVTVDQSSPDFAAFTDLRCGAVEHP